MDQIVTVITDTLAKVKDVQVGMLGIFGALVALALLAIIFSRIGGK